MGRLSPPRRRRAPVGSGAAEIVGGCLAAVIAFVVWLVLSVLSVAIPVLVVLVCLSLFGVI